MRKNLEWDFVHRLLIEVIWCEWQVAERNDCPAPTQMHKWRHESQVKSSHLYLYSAFNNTNCDKATAQYQNGKIVSIM